MNRNQRRAAGKGQSDERIVLREILLTFEDGRQTAINTAKVQIVDRETGRPLFEEVLEPIGPKPPPAEPTAAPEQQSAESYTVQFDTPEGRMEYVKKGEWSGVRRVNQ